MTAETIRAAPGATFGTIRAVPGAVDYLPRTMRCDGHTVRRRKHCLQQEPDHGNGQDSKRRECGSLLQSYIGYRIPRTYSIPKFRVRTEGRLWRNSHRSFHE